MNNEKKGDESGNVQNIKRPKNLNKVKRIKTTPDIELGWLKVWVHKYQFPDAITFYDSNWLVATACCTGRETEIRMKGAFLLTTDLDSWVTSLEAFDYAKEKVLSLISLQNQLMLDVAIRTPERIHIKVDMTPGGSEQHFYYYDVDPSAMRKFVEDIKKVLAKFPVREK